MCSAMVMTPLLGSGPGSEAQIMPLGGEIAWAAPPRQSGGAAARDVNVTARKPPQVRHQEDVAAPITRVDHFDSMVEQSAPRRVDRAEPGTPVTVVVTIGEMGVAVTAAVVRRCGRTVAVARVTRGRGGFRGSEDEKYAETGQRLRGGHLDTGGVAVFWDRHRRLFLLGRVFLAPTCKNRAKSKNGPSGGRLGNQEVDGKPVARPSDWRDTARVGGNAGSPW